MSASPPTDRVIDILELLASRPTEPLSLSDIGRLTNQNLATCHAITVTLTERGWLNRDEDTKAFTLGAATLTLGRAAAEAHPMARSARTELEMLHAELDMQATSATCDGDMITVVEAAGGPDATPAVGHKVPHAAPLGSVFVAWSSAEAQQSWLERTPGIDGELAEAIVESLAETRKRGYVVEWHTDETMRLRIIIASLSRDGADNALQGHLLGLLAELSRSGYLGKTTRAKKMPVSVIGAPVMGPQGEVLFDIAVQPLRVLTQKELKATGARVVAAAERIQAQFHS